MTVNAHKKSLTLTYQNQTVEIQLLDNPFVYKWACHVGKILGLFTHKQFFGTFPYLLDVNNGRTQITQSALALEEAVTQLRLLNVGFPEDFTVVETKNLDLVLQQKLNRLHRYFTWCDRHDIGKNLFWGPDQPVTGPRDSATLEKINQITHRMNNEIHKLEAYVATPNKFKLMKDQYTELAVEFDIYDNPMVPDPTRVVWRFIEPEDFQYLSNNPDYDVWLPNQILGKPYNIACYDHDDPTQWDITHPIGYTGNFVVGVNGNKATHMNNPFIIEWLKSHGINPGPDISGMPLGRIISGREHLPQWHKQATRGKIDNMLIELNLD